MCVYLLGEDSIWMCESQRTIFKSWFSPITWVTGIEWVIRFGSKNFHPLSQLCGPKFSTRHIQFFWVFVQFHEKNYRLLFPEKDPTLPVVTPLKSVAEKEEQDTTISLDGLPWALNLSPPFTVGVQASLHTYWETWGMPVWAELQLPGVSLWQLIAEVSVRIKFIFQDGEERIRKGRQRVEYSSKRTWVLQHTVLCLCH